jgi:hypothetical protein
MIPVVYRMSRGGYVTDSGGDSPATAVAEAVGAVAMPL